MKNRGDLSKLLPKPLGDFWYSVEPDTIKLIVTNESLYPLKELVPDKGVFLLQVRQTSQPAVLHIGLVSHIVVTVDDAVGMVVFLLVEGTQLLELCHPHVVEYYVHHHPDVSSVALTHQLLQVLFTSELLIYLVDIFGPVSVVPSFCVLYYW